MDISIDWIVDIFMPKIIIVKKVIEKVIDLCNNMVLF